MRALGLSLVILSLGFSTGGVALRSNAEPDRAAKASPAGGEAPSQCRVAQPRSWHVAVGARDRSAARSFVPLNGQGYNYGESGVWRPPVATAHTPPAAGVPGRDPVPAAPAK